MPLIPAFWRQSLSNLCEFRASVVYKASPGQPGPHSETLSKQTKDNATVAFPPYICLTCYYTL